uniref:Uncharacterized protein n=1 Tax=Anopheles minimus TaxID=112268 RepID=A0A182WL56_9DIPT
MKFYPVPKRFGKPEKDCLAFVLLLSLILILALGTHYSAGLSEVFSRATEHERIEFFKGFRLIAVFLMNFYTGLMTFAHYSDCDPLAAGQITAKDQLLPFYVMDVFGHIKFMAGIFVAGIFAASLGTVAAALNSLAAVASEDLLEAGMQIKIPAGKGALYAKWMSLG